MAQPPPAAPGPEQSATKPGWVDSIRSAQCRPTLCMLMHKLSLLLLLLRWLRCRLAAAATAAFAAACTAHLCLLHHHRQVWPASDGQPILGPNVVHPAQRLMGTRVRSGRPALPARRVSFAGHRTAAVQPSPTAPAGMPCRACTHSAPALPPGCWLCPPDHAGPAPCGSLVGRGFDCGDLCDGVHPAQPHLLVQPPAVEGKSKEGWNAQSVGCIARRATTPLQQPSDRLACASASHCTAGQQLPCNCT